LDPAWGARHSSVPTPRGVVRGHIHTHRYISSIPRGIQAAN
jgi:hypothetical protein